MATQNTNKKYYAVIYNKMNIEVARHERPTIERAIKALEFYCKLADDWGTVEDENYQIYASLQYKKILRIKQQ